MDVSLDDYWRGTNKKGITARLGKKISPQKLKKQQHSIVTGNKQTKNTQFKVTGLGNVKPGNVAFDARAKIGKKNPSNMTLVVDARQKIGVQKGKASQDLRMKVNNMKARKMDARLKIKGGRQQKPEQQVIVTGLGRGPPSSNTAVKGQPIPSLVSGGGQRVQQVGRNIVKTMPPASNNRATGGRQPAGRVKMTGGGAIKITAKQQAGPVRDGRTPLVRIQNDHYVPPKPRQQPAVSWEQPAQQYNIQPQYVQQPQQPVDFQFEQSAQQVVYQEPVVTRTHQQPQPAPQPSFESTPITTQSHSSSYDQDTGGPYRVMVTNLHPIVTQDDLVELFGSIGALKRARLVKPGLAEILYMRRDDALSACKKYHMRELDGQPMQVNMTSLSKQKPAPAYYEPPQTQPQPEKIRKEPSVLRRTSPPTPPPVVDAPNMETDQATNYQPLRLGGAEKPGPKRMDMGLVHKALFKTPLPGQSQRPVTFTVKI